ncbi:MAG TPA: prolyl oligopeptidase family serine peptidase [Gammaproteobacteria bacterium]|nr:prolyl oligopeptidase family serine peptidase [Gammaproteobacteria bacterium]
MKRAAPCGSWPSPLSVAAAAGAQLRYSQPQVAGGDYYWIESRPQEDGRAVLVRSDGERDIRDLTPAPLSVRSRVHEYGGGAYAVAEGQVYFCNDADQCIYILRDGTPARLTPPGMRRYGDLLPDLPRRRLICVCEDHAGAPDNFLATISLDDGGLVKLAAGRDFYSSPALSPDGRELAWLAWDQPQMPWDGTELWIAAIGADGRLQEPRRLAGSADESVFQPRYSPDGVLHYVSDRSGYWNIYRCEGNTTRPLARDAADYGYAQWNLGMSSYGFLSAQEIAAVRIAGGRAKAVYMDTTTGACSFLMTGCSHIEHLDADQGRYTLVGGGPETAITVLQGEGQTVRPLREPGFRLDAGYLSRAEALDFPTTGGERAKAWYYPPMNAEHSVPVGELPPLIVRCHGGPTSMNGDALDPRIQFWTSRGFAVADVNYRGSTGYGRAYRRSLAGQWGVKDVEDCIQTLAHLSARALADPKRAAISGSSAGGYTALAALAFHDVFRAGAVYYGIGELVSAMTDTHKFEARYGDSLLGPWPAAKALYNARSPLYAADRIKAPVIFFQGLKDKVVLPEQTFGMLAALHARKIPAYCLTFPEEGHGFRRADSLERALSAELAFYARVFGFTPVDTLPPLPMERAGGSA